MKLWSGVVAMVAVVLVAVAPEANSAAGTPITSCGQVVTTNAFLTGDLLCSGSHGVVAGASGITIDLKGFIVLGDNTNGKYGILVTGAFDKVTIKNATVRHFDYGVYALADKIVVSNVVATGNTNCGICIVGADATVKSSTGSATFNSGTGISINGDRAYVQSSMAAANSGGIGVVGEQAKIQSSIASGNDYGGIEVNGTPAALKGNRAEGNGFEGGASDFNGTGIRVTGYTTLPTGKNIARGNDNPNECDPTVLC